MLRSSLATHSGKAVSLLSRLFHLGAGATWPGEIALRIDPYIVGKLSRRMKKGIVLVAGTNGKTTTTRMIQTILEKSGQTAVHNKSGANLHNGVVSAFIQHASWNGSMNADWGVFEVDENSLPAIITQLNRHSGHRAGIQEEEDGSRVKPGMTQHLIIVLLNLFRDQLDRYGEVDVIAEKWTTALRSLPRSTQVVLNADDPLISYLGKAVNSRPGPLRRSSSEASLGHEAFYFGLEEPSLQKKELEHATDSIFCLNCGARLVYKGVYYSHLGVWFCPKCGEKRQKPDVSNWKSPLPGVYNRYNTLAAVATAKAIGISDTTIKKSLEEFTPAFGRQEEFDIHGKKVKIFLSKNPAGFNESLRTVLSLGATQILFVLNDRIPDGRDVSWIWDVDFEMVPGYITPVVSGDRSYDVAVRLKYAKPYHKLPKGAASEPQTIPIVFENLSTAVEFCLGNKSGETLYILPTYSAMLEARKILTGKKIL